MADSSDIDAAVINLLALDGQLKTLLPDGVFYAEAPAGLRNFAIVSVIRAIDEPEFSRRAAEDIVYLVKAVCLGTSGTNIKQAAARIDVLLENQPLTAAGYGWMTMHRIERIRYLEVDDLDTSIRWQHRGGQYRVQMALAGV